MPRRESRMSPHMLRRGAAAIAFCTSDVEDKSHSGRKRKRPAGSTEAGGAGRPRRIALDARARESQACFIRKEPHSRLVHRGPPEEGEWFARRGRLREQREKVKL